MTFFVGNESYSSIVNPGNTVAKITCKGTDVINITKTEILKVTTKCHKNECTLSDDDRKYISSNCEGKTTCEVSLDHMVPCLSKMGFIDVNYTCQSKLYSRFIFKIKSMLIQSNLDSSNSKGPLKCVRVIGSSRN